MVRQAAVTIDAPARRPRDNARRGRRGREALPVRSTRLFGIPLAEVAYDDVLDLVNRALAAPSDTPLTLDAIWRYHESPMASPHDKGQPTQVRISGSGAVGLHHTQPGHERCVEFASSRPEEGRRSRRA